MIKQYQEKPLRDLTFAIVGLGLIGGSYAKALRNLKVRKILGMDISHGIARACLNANMIDEVIEADGSNLKEADVIICSVYPEAIVGFRSGRDYLQCVSGSYRGFCAAECAEYYRAYGKEFTGSSPLAGRVCKSSWLCPFGKGLHGRP